MKTYWKLITSVWPETCYRYGLLSAEERENMSDIWILKMNCYWCQAFIEAPALTFGRSVRRRHRTDSRAHSGRNSWLLSQNWMQDGPNSDSPPRSCWLWRGCGRAAAGRPNAGLVQLTHTHILLFTYWSFGLQDKCLK